MKKAEIPIAGHYIVVLKDDEHQKRGKVKHEFKTALKGYSAELTPEELEALVNDPSVDYVEEDGVIKISAVQTGATYGLDRIDQIDLPLDGNFNYEFDGTGVTAYVIDSGINFNHEDFGGRAVLGLDTVGGDGSDCIGHGTHVSGTIGGAVYGVAKNVQLVAMRMLDCAGNGTISSLVACIDWITANHIKPAVVNISLSYGGSSPSVDTAINNSIDYGVHYVVASGNGGYLAAGQGPGSNPRVITVAAFGEDDTFWLGSDYGSAVDVCAPGIMIVSDWIGSNTATNIQGGTSMAAPHVAGVVAQYLSVCQHSSPDNTATQLLTQAIPNKLSQVKPDTPNLIIYSGFVPDSPSILIAPKGDKYNGKSVSGQTNYFPDEFGRSASSLSAQIDCLSGVETSLSIEMKQGKSWKKVATGEASVSYSGKNGSYRVAVTGVSGVGGFNLFIL